MNYFLFQFAFIVAAQPAVGIQPKLEPLPAPLGVFTPDGLPVIPICRRNDPETEVILDILTDFLARNGFKRSLRGVHVIDVERVAVPREAGTVQVLRLRGIVQAERQRQGFQLDAETELESDKDKFDWPFTQPVEVDVSKMYVGQGCPLSDIATVRLIERFMDDVLTIKLDRPLASSDRQRVR